MIHEGLRPGCDWRWSGFNGLELLTELLWSGSKTSDAGQTPLLHILQAFAQMLRPPVLYKPQRLSLADLPQSDYSLCEWPYVMIDLLRT